MSKAKSENDELNELNILYKEQRSRFKNISDTAERYFKHEFRIRYPMGDYKEFLKECEKLTPRQIEEKLIDLDYENKNTDAEELNLLNNFLAQFSESPNDIPNDLTEFESEDEGVMILEPWMTPAPKAEEAQVHKKNTQTNSNQTVTRDFKDSLNNIKESNEPIPDVEHEFPTNKI
ncbi:hypothetical protein [uncultured Legionella sp.]|uniref:hypothetical protein n=1 Tax=uncultured Legionella sp. TaxID=210934 RepID=UPI0026244EA0|nr:hypothetical protein [uncultured Legionella sp.]